MTTELEERIQRVEREIEGIREEYFLDEGALMLAVDREKIHQAESALLWAGLESLRENPCIELNFSTKS